MATQKFVTVATIEPCILGDRFKNVPPHITLCPPFTAGSDRIDEYHARMRQVMDENPRGVHVVRTEPMLYGEKNDIPVTKTWVPLIEGSFNIHCGAYVGAKVIGQVDDTYAGLNWSPHSTTVEGFEMPKPPFYLREVQLFRYQPDGLKRVIAVYAAMWASILAQKDW